MVTPEFIPGAIYRSKTHGLVEYKRVDTFMGQRTLEFLSLKYGTINVLPDALDRHFNPSPETATDECMAKVRQHFNDRRAGCEHQYESTGHFTARQCVKCLQSEPR